MVYIMAHLLCCTFYGFWQMKNDMYLHYNVIQNKFTALKSQDLPIHSWVPWNHWYFYCLHSFAFTKLYSWNHISMWFFSFIGSQPYAFIYILCIFEAWELSSCYSYLIILIDKTLSISPTFALQQRSWVVATKTIWSTKQKSVYYLAIYGKFVDPWSMEKGGSPTPKLFSRLREYFSSGELLGQNNHSISSEVWVNVEEHVDKDNRIG